MRHTITALDKGFPAARAGVLPGDVLLTLNGEPVIDEIDYQALIAEKTVTLGLERAGEPLEIVIRKDEGDPLGLHFGESMTLKPRTCHNNCMFCFIAQMPPNMRETLYVKDDDWRFSLMMGNFVTLTNVSEEEFQRIIRRKASPLYISVHATDPQLRCKLMNNRFAGNIMERLTRLKEAGIHFHCQIVTCPGLNDGEVLLRTLRDLRSLWPAARTAAMVPVGLTKFREHLPKLEIFNRQTAGEFLDMLAPFQEECRRELGTTFAFPSDEFYCLAGREVPEENWYEEFPQIENGVGLVRRFLSEFHAARNVDLSFGEPEIPEPKHYVIPTGVSFAPILDKLTKQYAPEGTTFRVIPVKNRFFGETVTVTGLLTGGDLLAALTEEALQGADAVLLCNIVLRHEQDLFLDDMSLEEFRARLPLPLQLMDNDGGALYEALYSRFDD